MTHMTALRAAATSTFEELSFLLPTPGLTALQAAAEPVAEAVAAFRGPRSGSLTVTVYGQLLPELAANMLGCLEPPDPVLQREALGKLANEICGKLLPLVDGDVAVFQLEPPRVSEGRGPAGPGETLSLGFENGRVDVRLSFDGAA